MPWESHSQSLVNDRSASLGVGTLAQGPADPLPKRVEVVVVMHTPEHIALLDDTLGTQLLVSGQYLPLVQQGVPLAAPVFLLPAYQAVPSPCPRHPSRLSADAVWPQLQTQFLVPAPPEQFGSAWAADRTPSRWCHSQLPLGSWAASAVH